MKYGFILVCSMATLYSEPTKTLIPIAIDAIPLAFNAQITETELYAQLTHEHLFFNTTLKQITNLHGQYIALLNEPNLKEALLTRAYLIQHIDLLAIRYDRLQKRMGALISHHPSWNIKKIDSLLQPLCACTHKLTHYRTHFKLPSSRTQYSQAIRHVYKIS